MARLTAAIASGLIVALAAAPAAAAPFAEGRESISVEGELAGRASRLQGRISFRADLAWRFDTLLGEPVSRCEARISDVKLVVELPEGGYRTTTPEEAALVRVYDGMMLGRIGNLFLDRYYWLRCDLGLLGRAGGAAPFNVPSSPEWEDLFCRSGKPFAAAVWDEEERAWCTPGLLGGIFGGGGSLAPAEEAKRVAKAELELAGIPKRLAKTGFELAGIEVLGWKVDTHQLELKLEKERLGRELVAARLAVFERQLRATAAWLPVNVAAETVLAGVRNGLASGMSVGERLDHLDRAIGRLRAGGYARSLEEQERRAFEKALDAAALEAVREEDLVLRRIREGRGEAERTAEAGRLVFERWMEEAEKRAALALRGNPEQLEPYRAENGLWGYRDPEGGTVIEPRFKEAQRFSGAYAVAAAGKDSFGLIDLAGNWVAGPSWPAIAAQNGPLFAARTGSGRVPGNSAHARYRRAAYSVLEVAAGGARRVVPEEWHTVSFASGGIAVTRMLRIDPHPTRSCTDREHLRSAVYARDGRPVRGPEEVTREESFLCLRSTRG
ncbi:hypothetical protein SH611_05800 [Geminicoccaceae bacterium 1502E]|nr:hypothetical protein [Geminicoccaceae bacterium 1502E]